MSFISNDNSNKELYKLWTSNSKLLIDPSIIAVSASKYYVPYEIKDVNILVENKVVEVTFADGTKQKSVCMEPDTFSLETAIAVCISKKLIGGTKNYNDAIRKGVKFYENKQKNQKELEELQKSLEAKRAKRRAKKQKRAEERAKQEREEQIAIHTEAYIRALRATGNVKYADDLK